MAQSFTGARSGIENTRLAAEEMGLRIPRAMQRVVAGNAELAGALQATMGLFVAIGAIAIFEQMVEGAANLYEKWFDVTKAVEAYQQKAMESATTKLFETASIEETVVLLKQANAEIDELAAKKHAAGADRLGGGFTQWLTKSPDPNVRRFWGQAEPYTSADDQEAAKAQGRQEQGIERQRHLEDEFQMQRLKGQAAFDSVVDQGYAKIAAHERDAIAENNLRSQQEQANAKALAERSGQFYDPKSGEAQRLAGNAVIEQEAAGQRIAMARAESEQIIALQNEAIDAGVKGEALADEQRQQAIDAVTRKYQAGEISKRGALAETEAIDMKFHNQKMARLEEEQYQTAKIQQEAQQAGLTGLAKIQTEGQNKIEDLYSNPANASLDDENLQKRRVAYEQETDQQIVAAHQQFTQEINGIDQRGNQFMTQGYAKIEADTGRLLGALAGDFDMVTWAVSVDQTTACNIGGVEPISAIVTNSQATAYLVGV